ncbi:hypothetical protein, partial [Burkholderia vietnamiensis]|uniref:hypothetical protein n=1 Tax=Burkholderia vietnamiensis TaxID=60552 RepID=UPI001E6003BB
MKRIAGSRPYRRSGAPATRGNARQRALRAPGRDAAAVVRACEFVRRPGAPRLRGGSAGGHAHAPVRAFSMHATERELMISQSIFKAYDIRGVVGKTLDA